MRLKWLKSQENLKKSRGSISKIKCFYSPKLILRSYSVQNVKDEI